MWKMRFWITEARHTPSQDLKERGRGERERERGGKMCQNIYTHTQRERERERENTPLVVEELINYEDGDGDGPVAPSLAAFFFLRR